MKQSAQNQFRDGSSKHVKIGEENRNGQVCLGTRGKKSTNKPEQDVFKMRCTKCDNVYGANGCDVWLRLCSNRHCQGGKGEDLEF